MYIASQEGFTLHEDAAGMIARLSDGGMRDALSLLDQCVAYENDITLDVVSSASGIAGRDYLFDILLALEARHDDFVPAFGAPDFKIHAGAQDQKFLSPAWMLLFHLQNIARSYIHPSAPPFSTFFHALKNIL